MNIYKNKDKNIIRCFYQIIEKVKKIQQEKEYLLIQYIKLHNIYQKMNDIHK